MNVSEFIIVTTKETSYGLTELKPHIVCSDGFTMSLQAGKGLYCTPRETSFEYTAVEIGYPSSETICRRAKLYRNCISLDTNRNSRGGCKKAWWY